MSAIASLIAAGIATAGAVGSAVNNKKAREEQQRQFRKDQARLEMEYYRDPLSTITNKTLLKSAKEFHKDNLDAINNRMVAGGATFENQLAARQASNEGMDNLYAQLLRGEDARRQRNEDRQMGLDQQNSLYKQNSYLQDAQNWQAWGAQTANAAMSYGNAQLLNT